MNFLPQEIEKYSELFSAEESDLLKNLNRNTHLQLQSSRMLSGHLQGRFLSFISKLIQPTSILEIGTYSGYSALCLAEGLSENGKLITIDPNEETNVFAQSYFNQSAFKKQINLIQGDALKIIPTLNQTFDLVFIDADKKNYSNYFDLLFSKVKIGGLIIADNVLWSGKVTLANHDEDTKLIHQFNQKIKNDSRLECMLLPLRDGLMIMRKIK